MRLLSAGGVRFWAVNVQTLNSPGVVFADGVILDAHRESDRVRILRGWREDDLFPEFSTGVDFQPIGRGVDGGIEGVGHCLRRRCETCGWGDFGHGFG